jgi:hypothetical protein
MVWPVRHGHIRAKHGICRIRGRKIMNFNSVQ